MNNKIFKALVNLSNIDNLKLALNEIGDNELTDRIAVMLVDEHEILTRENISISKLIKLIEIEYENRRTIVVKNITNIDNFNGRIYADITYDKVRFSKIENDTKESNDLRNYPDETYKYPVIFDKDLSGSISVSFLNYNGDAKDIFDYDVMYSNNNDKL